MLKNTFVYIIKIILIGTALSAPTIIITTYDFHFKSYFFLYGTSLLLFGVVTFVSLYIWKKSYTSFALSLGFIITIITKPLKIYLTGGALWRFYGGIFGQDFAVIVWSIIYSFPFAIISLLPTIPTAIRWYKLRKVIIQEKTIARIQQNTSSSPSVCAPCPVLQPGQSDITNKTVDSTESGASNETDK